MPKDRFQVVTRKTGYVVTAFNRQDLAERFIKDCDDKGDCLTLKIVDIERPVIVVKKDCNPLVPGEKYYFNLQGSCFISDNMNSKEACKVVKVFQQLGFEIISSEIGK